MAKEIYRCEPCNYEYEWLFFDTVPRDKQKPVPPCPLCGKDLVGQEQELADDYFYRCWPSQGGCGLEALVEYPKGKAPETRECFQCGKQMNLGVRPGSFGIVHGNSMTKGASIDVAIGRDADRRWESIHERKAQRDKVRKEAGTDAITATGIGEYKPIKGAHLEAVKTTSEVNIPRKKN